MPSTSWLVFIGTLFNPCSQDICLHVLFSFSWSHTQRLVPTRTLLQIPPPIIHHYALYLFIAQLTIGSVLKVSKRLVILLWNNWSKRNVGKTPDGLPLSFFSRVPVLWLYPSIGLTQTWCIKMAELDGTNCQDKPLLHLFTQTTTSISLGLCPLSLMDITPLASHTPLKHSMQVPCISSIVE